MSLLFRVICTHLVFLIDEEVFRKCKATSNSFPFFIVSFFPIDRLTSMPYFQDNPIIRLNYTIEKLNYYRLSGDN